MIGNKSDLEAQVCLVTFIRAGWPPNQGIQGIQGKVREFKKVKNSQGKRHKNAAKSGKKH